VLDEVGEALPALAAAAASEARLGPNSAMATAITTMKPVPRTSAHPERVDNRELSPGFRSMTAKLCGQF
jgi:hypothetical protein